MSRPWEYIIGDELLRLRKEAGLTQEKVSVATKVSRPNVARMERGIHATSMLLFARYCVAVGADPGAALNRVLAQYDRER